MGTLAPLIKDKSFSGEAEWRLMSPISFSKLDYRPSRSMIVPYFRLLIGTDQDFDCLSELVVAPTPNPELSKASVHSLLESQGLKNIAVRASKVPYRNW